MKSIKPSIKRKSYALLLLCAGLGVSLSRGGTFIVNTTADSGAGSLRQAILDADGSPGSNTITFQISGTAPFTITPLSALPSVAQPTLIDGTTQSGFAGTPVIELNGTSAGSGSPGLQLFSSAGFCAVRGLAINRFSAQGIIFIGPSNTVQTCYIGTDVTGKIARANGSFGIWVKSSGNVIGGTNAGDGNVIAGGNDTGIYSINASGNRIQGNLIGVNAPGTNALGNVNNGIVLDNSSGNQIGGTDALARNIIAGNGQSGIYLNGSGATGNVIQGNYVGVDISGNLVASNANYGIILNGAPGNILGGTAAGAGNIISGNGYSGVALIGSGATSNMLLGNFIGTDVTGKIALANKNAGVTLSAAIGNLVGGTNAGSRNVISGNSQDGVYLETNATANVIQGNYIGLSSAGTNAVPNGFNGVSFRGASTNTIGGLTVAARNVISGNANNGVGILALTDSANVISGNYIGTDFSGRLAVSNTLAGIRIQGCSNFIGSAASGGGNVISGNGTQGIWLVGTNGSVTGNWIQGNLVGVDYTGANPLGNGTLTGNAGIGITSAGRNQIGGIGTGNIISANGDAGVFLLGVGTTGNQLQGNFIGTDATGTVALGNKREGIYMQQAATNTIGGSVAGAGNVISGNTTRGIFLNPATWNVIQGNFIGTQINGSNALGNIQHNVELEAGSTNNLIGGFIPGAGNQIAFAQTAGPNAYAGVRVRVGALNNLISGNAIFGNAALGIDLGTAGVTLNDDCDGDTGANQQQNFPTLSNAYSGTITRVRGTLNTTSTKTYLLQFFASPAADSSGYGEGQVFLGQTNLTLGATCSSNFTAYLSATVPTGWVISATATDSANNTSEFSATVPVVSVPPLQIATINVLPGQLAIFWATNSGTNFILQQTFNMAPPLWTTVLNTPSLTNGFYLMSVPTTNPTCFYRLNTL